MRTPTCDEAVLSAIWQHWVEYNSPPSVQYLVNNCCLSSKNSVFYALRRLEKRGDIVLNEYSKAIPEIAVKPMKKMMQSLEKEYDEREESTATA